MGVGLISAALLSLRNFWIENMSFLSKKSVDVDGSARIGVMIGGTTGGFDEIGCLSIR